jgi:hypothetical protein
MLNTINFKAVVSAGVLALAFNLCESVAAHTDSIASVRRADIVYAAPEPLGPIQVLQEINEDYAATRLRVRTALWEVEVPVEAMANLPRPSWNSMRVAYSLTSFDPEQEGRAFVDRPYVYVEFTLHGPRGVSWQRTSVIYHLDADGELTRQLKQFIEKEDDIRVVWEDWPVDSSLSAAEVLDAAVADD